MPVITGAELSADIEERIRALVSDAVFVDALKLAEEAGTAARSTSCLSACWRGIWTSIKTPSSMPSGHCPAEAAGRQPRCV